MVMLKHYYIDAVIFQILRVATLIRSFAERTAMNTPIQGSAADIIKLAMVQFDKNVKKQTIMPNYYFKCMMN